MKTTFEQYMRNPLGKNNPLYNAAVKEAIRTDYSRRLNFILVRENSKIDYTWYEDAKHNTYYCHLKIPSETVPHFYYDVVIKFFADSDVAEGGRNLEHYYVQFFSNDPSFVYSFANAMIANDLFIKDLKPRMSKLAVKKPAKEKNPQGFTGYVKTIYFAYLFLKERNLLNISAIGDKMKYDPNALLREVRDADKVIEDRKEKGKDVKKGRIVKDKAQNTQITDPHTVGTVKSVGKIKSIGSIGKTKQVKSIKKR